MRRLEFAGLDFHTKTIAVAVDEQDGEVRTLGVIPNREELIGKHSISVLYRMRVFAAE